MGLQRTTYTDADGRKRVVLLPEGVPESEAERGVPVGPPSLEELGLPLEMEVRLHNELFNRGILTGKDALHRRADVLGAIQTAFKVDVSSVVDAYIGKDYKNARREKEAPRETLPQIRNTRRRRR